jgi:hypothetical protein
MKPSQSLPLQGVERHDRALLATSPNALVDLYGGPDAVYRIRSDQFEAFREIEGIEPGLGHEDGLSLRLLGAGKGGPRRALFLGRRLVMGLRFDPLGRPAQARWIHLPYDQREYVTMHPEGDRVWLVEATGTVTALDAFTGRVLLRRDVDQPARGAVFVGGEPPSDEPKRRSSDSGEVVGALVSVIEEPDARLRPAQQLALDLLWRHERPDVRGLAREVASGTLRPRDPATAEALQTQALALLDSPWGSSSRQSLTKLRQRLDTPARLDDEAWDEAMRELLAAGSPALLDRAAELLDDPSVSAAGLTRIARALRDLGDSRAVEGVAVFVRKYHADPEVVGESQAMFYGVEFLLAQAFPEQLGRVLPEQSQHARDTLQLVLDNEFTVPVVRTYVEDRLPVVPEPDPEPTSEDGEPS